MLIFGRFILVGGTRIVFSKLEGPLPTPVPVTISESEAEPQAAAPVGETITIQKAEDKKLPHKSMDEDSTSPKKESSAELLPSESWVVVTPPKGGQSTTSVTDEPNGKSANKKEDIPYQPAIGDTASDHDVKQAWSGSSDNQGSAMSATQPPPAAPPSNSSSGLVHGGSGKGIEVEDIEESEVKEDHGVDEAVSNAVFTFGEKEEEEPEEKFSTPSAATPQVSELLQVHVSA